MQQIVERMTNKITSQFFSPNVLLYGSEYSSKNIFVGKMAKDVFVNWYSSILPLQHQMIHCLDSLYIFLSFLKDTLESRLWKFKYRDTNKSIFTMEIQFMLSENAFV